MGLLSEQTESQAIPFPAKQRRLGSLQTNYGQSGLLIDILRRDIGEDLVNAFERGGGPRAFLQAWLATFLTSLSLTGPVKLTLVQYFFLDLANLLSPDTWPDLVVSLIKFPSAFSLPPPSSN